MEVHFYPGQHLLVVLNGARVIAKFEAMGGPASIGSDPRMPEEPTWAGEYVIDKAHPYHTPSWLLSRLKWGTPLKDMPGKNDVWYQMSNGMWASVKNDLGLSRNEIIKQYFDLYSVNKVPDKWVFNDFGPVAIRWYKDTNKNNKLDGKEVLSGQMFHTTPIDEARTARGLSVNLVPSHGCIHLKPGDRDKLMSLSAFKQGTRFIVHEYHEKF
ncbi:hypothetical protein EUZ85_15080 [Hahella sp. KA22]|uniref:L,D-transpeptidase family protein n=1 Tax=Hahella sp. KA22 TaxID=1628392 RepID=UPI000FDF5B3A|nr:L,D-transpeptidase family protein [Hahella sp. KA22]AZZ91983.1 hypothetical protein ENC22_12515 [Hahella sp. KA22]QAY55354.1 hypothetical protein EUZ85_15080 [Hahella sp. KA22]